MLLKRFDRILSLCVIAGFASWWFTTDIGWKHSLGKDGYLSYQSGYFDHYYSRPFHPISSAIAYFVMVALFFAMYEGLALFIRRVGTEKDVA
jgi:hypothetical protein